MVLYRQGCFEIRLVEDPHIDKHLAKKLVGMLLYLKGEFKSLPLYETTIQENLAYGTSCFLFCRHYRFLMARFFVFDVSITPVFKKSTPKNQTAFLLFKNSA